LHSSALAAQDIGGSLWAESDGPGSGSTFTLELPISPAESRRSASASAARGREPHQAAVPDVCAQQAPGVA